MSSDDPIISELSERIKEQFERQEGRKDAVEDLRTWWERTTSNDLDAILPKVEEYTAIDLDLMGQFMEQWLDLPANTGAEAACMFYALGKLARAVAAYREGRLPSEDTLMDLTVYTLMARRIREVGGWPH